MSAHRWVGLGHEKWTHDHVCVSHTGRSTEGASLNKSEFSVVSEHRLKQNVFSFLRSKSVDRSSFTSVGSLFHAATEKALSSIRRHVRGMTRFPHPHDVARSADRARISATGVSKSEMYSGVCPRSSVQFSSAI